MTDIPLTLADPDLLQSSPISLAHKALRVPAEMVLQIASGLDDPAEIALRYGYTAEQFTALQAWQPFQQDVAKARAELEKTGFDFTLDARVKARELSDTIFVRAMREDATFSQVHDAFRTFTEFGDLKPKPAPTLNTPGGTNPGFSISIVFAPNSGTPASHTPNDKTVIDITPTRTNSDLTVDIPPKEVMGTRNPFCVGTTLHVDPV